MNRDKTRDILKQLKKKMNVTGGSLTPKLREIDGKFIEGTEVLRVYVEKKVPLSALQEKDRLPKTVNIDGKEYEIDVVILEKLWALDAVPLSYPNPKEKYRPLRMGISSMNARSDGACTLGAFARYNPTDQIVQLSNQHCFGLENNANPGDIIIQPSKLDNGKIIDETGRFVNGVNLLYDTYTCRTRNAGRVIYEILKPMITQNVVDVSCASINDDIDFEMKAPNDMKINDWCNPGDYYQHGDGIWAYGRTSSFSYGTNYTDLDGYVQVAYQRGTCSFEDIVIGLQSTTFKCIPGDSGSFWAEDDKIAGLRFAGGTYTWIGCKWSNIQRELNISFINP